MEKTTNRIIPVIAAVAIQLSLGVAYIWSVFQNGIAHSLFGGDNQAAGLTFSILLATLTLGSTVGGKLTSKFGYRKVVIAGGLILGAGFFLASFVTSQAPYMLWLTYGLMGGVGMGFTYSTTISCAQNWFPDKRGLITGIIVAALGFGGVIFTPIIEWLVARFGGEGVGEPKTFMVLSVVFVVVCTIGGLFIVNPPADYRPKGFIASSGGSGSKVNYTPGQTLSTPQFYLITATLMLACMGGLMMIGFAKPIAVARGMASTATIGVLVISLFNSLGRLFWGFASDKLGRKRTIQVLIVCNGILSLLVNVAQGYLIYVLIAFIGFCYGGFLSTFPALTSDTFGSTHMATNYGMVLMGFGVGAVASSFIAGYYKNLAVNDISLMFPAFLIASAASLVGLVLISLVKAPKAPLAADAAAEPETV